MYVAKVDNTKEWTIQEYEKLEEGLLAQLIEGELIMSPAPAPNHQRVVRRLYDLIRSNLATKGEIFFSPIDLYISDRDVFQPDLIYIREMNKSIITGKGIEGVPDLVAEVISPSNSVYDRNIKKKKYLQIGVGEYWIVDPANKTLEVYSQNEDKPDLYLVESGQVVSKFLECKVFDLTEVFKNLD